MGIEELLRYLDSRRVKYKLHRHEQAFRAEHAARAADLPRAAFAKGVLVRVLDRPPGHSVLVVVAADSRVDLEALRELVGCPVLIATEQDVARIFPAFEPGVAPPMSELALESVPVLVDSQLADAETIAFRAGTFTEVVEMPWSEFARVAALRIVRCARPR